MKLPVLPRMRCDTGCGDCCGPVPVDALELHRVREHARAKGITPKAQGIVCPFYQEGKCAVYEVRPTLCVLFGHLRGLKCSRGYNTNAFSQAKEYEILRRLAHGPEKRHLLHELLPREEMHGPDGEEKAHG